MRNVFAKNTGWIAAGAILAFAALEPTGALAAVAGPGAGGMPYDAGLTTLGQSIQGPVAFIISLVAVVCGIGVWIAGGQLEGLMKTIAQVVIGVCIVSGFTAFMTAIGATAGAVLT